MSERFEPMHPSPPAPYAAALLGAMAQLTRQLDAPDLPLRAARLVLEALPMVETALVWLVRREDRRLRAVAVAGAQAQWLQPALAHVVVEPWMGGPAWPLLQRQAQVLTSGAAYAADLQALGAQAEPLRSLGADRPSLHSVRLPLVVGGAALGVLELLTTQAQAASALPDLPTLQAVADHLALVLDDVRRADETQRLQGRLQGFEALVAAIASAADVQQLAERGLPALARLAGSEHALLALRDDGQVRVAALTGALATVVERQAWLVPEAAPLAAAERAGRPVVQTLGPEHPWAALQAAGIARLTIMPLLAGPTSVGVLILGWPDDQPDEEAQAILEALAPQLALAIVNQQQHSAGLREQRLLSSVIASLNEGVIICDRLGRLTLANRAAASLLGLDLALIRTRGELMQALQVRSLDGHSVPPEALPLSRALQGESYTDYEVEVTRGTGERAILCFSGAPLYADDGSIAGGVIVFRDLTEQKLHDAARSEFLAVAAHELRAPLAAVKGYADLLLQRELQRPDGSERDRRGMQMLARQIDHLVQLVDNLLNLSRLDAGRFDLYLQPVDLMPLLEACVDRMRMGDPAHQFELRGPESLPLVCDQLRVQQVLTNLLSNAARYSPAGTQVTVEVWTTSCTIEGGVVTELDGAEQCVMIAVRDQGVGMPPEVQARIFDRYFRANTSAAASGLGLGLYITREIVLRHGGKIWVESAPGQGTSVYVLLPVQAAPPRDAAAPALANQSLG